MIYIFEFLKENLLNNILSMISQNVFLLNKCMCIFKNFEFFINCIQIESNVELFNSSQLLFDEIDKIEWYVNIRQEVDIISDVPIDLAIKYGNEYFSNQIFEKINSSRQLYYKGMNLEILNNLPLSGSLSNVDNKFFFNFNKTNNFPSLNFKSDNNNFIEKYFEFNILDIDTDSKDLSLFFSNNRNDYYGFKYNIENFLDSNSIFKINYDNNPSLVQDFLNWRDMSFNHISSNDIDYSNFKNNYINDNLILSNEKKKQILNNETTQNFLSSNSFEFLSKNIFFDDKLDYEQKILNSLNFLEFNGGSIFDFFNINNGLNLDISELVSNIDEELLKLYNRFFLDNKNDIDRYKIKKDVKNLILNNDVGVNIFINYGIFLFRNPIFDFSYKTSISMHYDTLDKFWDKRPSVSGWLGSNIFGFGPNSSFLIKNKDSIFNSFDNKNLSKLNFGLINKNNYFIKQNLFDNFYNLYNLLYKFIKISINNLFLITKNVKFLTKYHVIIKKNEKNEKSFKKVITLNTNLFELKYLTLNNYFNNRSVGLIKNLQYGRVWPFYITKFENINSKILYLDLNIYKEKIISNKLINGLLIDSLVKNNINIDYFYEINNIFKYLFKDIGIVNINIIFSILYSVGLIDSDEYKTKHLKLTTEILLIIKIIQTLIFHNINVIKIIKIVNWILDNDIFWFEFSIMKQNKYSNFRNRIIKHKTIHFNNNFSNNNEYILNKNFLSINNKSKITNYTKKYKNNVILTYIPKLWNYSIHKINFKYLELKNNKILLNSQLKNNKFIFSINTKFLNNNNLFFKKNYLNG